MAKTRVTKIVKRSRLSLRKARLVAEDLQREARHATKRRGKPVSIKPSDTATGSGRVRFQAMNVIEQLAGGKRRLATESDRSAKRRKAG